MPSVGLIPLLCSCLMSSPSACATVPFAVSYTQPLLGNSSCLVGEQVISPTFCSAVSGQVIVVPAPEASFPPTNASSALAVASMPSASAAGLTRTASMPPLQTSSGNDTADGALASPPQERFEPTAVGSDSAVAAQPVVQQPITLMGQLEFVSPVIQYSNIPITLLDASNPVDRVAAVVSSNEGKPTTIDWNDNGHGVSVGIFQANQRVGELPQLLHQLAVIPQGQQAIAGAFGAKATQQIQNNPEAVRQWRFSPNNTLGRGLQKLVHNDLFQKLQIAVLRKKVTMAAQVAANHGITCSAGVAVCADLTNQWGRAGAGRFLKAADAMHSQSAKVSAIVSAVTKGSAYGGRYQSDLQKVQADGLSLNETFSLPPAGQTVETSYTE